MTETRTQRRVVPDRGSSDRGGQERQAHSPLSKSASSFLVDSGKRHHTRHSSQRGEKITSAATTGGCSNDKKKTKDRSSSDAQERQAHKALSESTSSFSVEAERKHRTRHLKRREKSQSIIKAKIPGTRWTGRASSPSKASAPLSSLAGTQQRRNALSSPARRKAPVRSSSKRKETTDTISSPVQNSDKAPASPSKTRPIHSMNASSSESKRVASTAPTSPKRKECVFQTSNASTSGSKISLTHHSSSNMSSMPGILSSMRSDFDVDAPPRDSVNKRHQPQDCHSVAESTVISTRYANLSKEEQAWAGIEGILDDDASIATRDVLPEAIINAMAFSFSNLPAPSYREKGKLKEEEQDDGDDDEEDSHNDFMKQLCGLKEGSGEGAMPNLMESSFSSIRSDMTDAQSILSYVSRKNTIVQDDDSEDEPMKEFIDTITGALERKLEVGPLEEISKDSGGNGIFNIFSWSSKANVDEIKSETQGHKSKFTDRHPEHEILMSPGGSFLHKPAFASSTFESFNNSLPSLASMPSLATYATKSGSTDSVYEANVKWGSFGDLNFNPGVSVGAPVNGSPHLEPFAFAAGFDEAQPRKPTKKRIVKKKVKMIPPTPVLKKKKLAVKISSQIVVTEPEALVDYYKPSHPHTDVPETPVRSNKTVKFASGHLGPMKNLMTPMYSKRVMPAKYVHYKESPFNNLRQKIFGNKGRRNSPTSVSALGRDESQFYPDKDYDDDDEEGLGGLLDY